MRGTARLYLVRHGESGWNEAGLVQGQSPSAPGLTEAGHRQAVAAAAALRGCGAELVLSSDLGRALQTARPIAAALEVPLVHDVRLRERNLGTAEGKPTSSVAISELGYEGETITDPDAHPGEGESIRQLYDRIAALLSEYAGAPPAPSCVVVTHGGPIRVALAFLSRTPVDVMGWPAVPNASVLAVDLLPDGTGHVSPLSG